MWSLVWAFSVVTQQFLGVIAQPTVIFRTEAFTLILDPTYHVATNLTSHAGPNAGTSDFGLLLLTANKTLDEHLMLGDLQLRVKDDLAAAWTDLSTHWKREPVQQVPNSAYGNAPSNGALLSTDVTASLHTNLPVKVTRSWASQGDWLSLSFNVSNTDLKRSLILGGVGIPIPINNRWVHETRAESQKIWTGYLTSDAAVSLDSGYVVTNRLNGQGPTLLTVPGDQTPLEQWRLNYDTNDKDGIYSKEWRDARLKQLNFEGIYSWFPVSAGIVDDDEEVARRLGLERKETDNKVTTVTLAAGQSRTWTLRFFTSSGPRNVEKRLRDQGRPTVVGIPGFIVSQGQEIKLLIHSSSAPVISEVSPEYIAFSPARKIAAGFYEFHGVVNPQAFGRCRVTWDLDKGELGTAHYSVMRRQEEQLDRLAQFRFEHQWFNQHNDYFNRSPSIISYDRRKREQVTDDARPWIAGLSDEAGAGSYVSAAVKQFARPDRLQVRKLEQFVKETLWAQVQNSDSKSSTYAGVKKSLFYYDPKLPVKYDPTIDRRIFTWDRAEANQLTRSYNYPHPVTVYWTLYRLARNYCGLVTTPWTWYLDRAYDTIMAMKRYGGIESYASFGLMAGSYFHAVLQDLTREGSLNATHARRAKDVEAFMFQRAQLWKNESYPLGSELTWDNTGQEEVFLWSRAFGNSDRATETAETVLAVLPSVPHWGYSSSSRSMWDFLYAGQWGPGARIERIFGHYKGAQAAYVLAEYFLDRPEDIELLRAAFGGVLGALSNILEDGFGSMGFHTRPDYWNWDPLSGDQGVSTALYILAARSVLVNHASLGGWAGFGGRVSQQGNLVLLMPEDGVRQRVFLAPIALYVELDSGKIRSAQYDAESHHVSVTLDPGDDHTTMARLRLTTTAQTTVSAHYEVLHPDQILERDAVVIPLRPSAPTLVDLVRKDDKSSAHL